MSEWRETTLPEASLMLLSAYGWQSADNVPGADPIIALARERGDSVDVLYRDDEMPPCDLVMQFINAQIPPRSEQMLVVNMSAMFIRSVAFTGPSDAFDDFVAHYEKEFSRPFYDYMDLILLWLSRGVSLIIHHEGLIALCRPAAAPK